MRRMKMREAVLYYNPDKGAEDNSTSTSQGAKLKGVLVQMGVRIRNITPDQVQQQVGYLTGMDGYEEQQRQGELPVIGEEVLVLQNFTGRRLDELLKNMRRAGVEKIKLKAVVTDTNIGWTFYQLYQEIKKEHETMSEKENG